MPKLNLRLVFLFYMGLFGVSLVWMALRGDNTFFVNPSWNVVPDSSDLLRGLGLGAATAAAVVILSRLAASNLSWAGDLERKFALLLGPLRLGDIAAISICSGIAEEAFFRGAMQPTIGWGLTTLVFGFLHIGPDRSYFPWTVMALVIGGILGFYYENTGTLIAPMVAHTLINFVNLIYINRALKTDES